MAIYAWVGALLFVSVFVSHPARAQSPGPAPAPGLPASAPTGLWERSTLLGDVFGVRSRLENAGVVFGLQEQSEVWGMLTGGRKQGAAYDGLTTASVKVDLDKLIGWTGGIFYGSAFQSHGNGPTGQVGNLQAISGIEATAATRLFELWLEQSFADGKVSVRIGQQSADQEFFITSNGAIFINSAFGFPTLPALDLPSGGPAFPLATPAVRLKAKPADELTLLAAAFNGDPAGPGRDNPQLRDASGTSFRFNDGVFAVIEAQYALNQEDGATGLPGTYRVGSFYHSGVFADQRFDATGVSLANPAGSGPAKSRRNNVGVYAVADQMVWRAKNMKDNGVSMFARVFVAPDDRNLASLSANIGATWKGAIPDRSDDTLAVGVAYVRVGDRARGLDRDTAFYTGSAYPVRSQETLVELTYQAQLTPWLQVQPSMQYVFNPGGGVLNSNNPAHRLGDAAIIGVRTGITF